MKNEQKTQLEIIEDVSKQIQKKVPSKKHDPEYLDKKVLQVRKKLKEKKEPKRNKKSFIEKVLDKIKK